MNNDANPSPFTPLFDRFLVEMIDMMPIDALGTISHTDAQRILDAMPEGMGRDAMRDAFRENIVTDLPFS